MEITSLKNKVSQALANTTIPEANKNVFQLAQKFSEEQNELICAFCFQTEKEIKEEAIDVLIVLMQIFDHFDIDENDFENKINKVVAKYAVTD